MIRVGCRKQHRTWGSFHSAMDLEIGVAETRESEQLTMGTVGCRKFRVVDTSNSADVVVEIVAGDGGALWIGKPHTRDIS